MSDLIAVIAPGEMGAAIGQRLRERGARVITSLAGRSPASAARAERAGLVAAASDDEIVAADIILSVVPPKDAVGLAVRLKPAIVRAAKKPIYVDCNAVAPSTAEEIGAILDGSGAAYVDGGIIGAPPTPTTPGARLYVSGARAGDVLRLGAYGLEVRLLDGPVGAASALKMSYAGITKGFTALGTAMMLAASRGGSADALKVELAESRPDLLRYLANQVPSMYSKAYRWVVELDEIAAFVGEEFPERDMLQAAARLYERMAEDFEDRKEEIGKLDRFLEKS